MPCTGLPPASTPVTGGPGMPTPQTTAPPHTGARPTGHPSAETTPAHPATAPPRHRPTPHHPGLGLHHHPAPATRHPATPCPRPFAPTPIRGEPASLYDIAMPTRQCDADAMAETAPANAVRHPYRPQCKSRHQHRITGGSYLRAWQGPGANCREGAWFLTEGGGGVARPGAGQAEPAPNAASGAAEAPKSRVDEVHREATPKAPLTLEGRPRTPAPPHHPNTFFADCRDTRNKVHGPSTGGQGQCEPQI